LGAPLGRYRSDAVNAVHAPALKLSVPPSRLAEHKRVRQALEPLQERYQALNEEFDRRASARWRKAS
jgi:hypothetical protein